jgi:hypothetical protein
MTERLFPNSPTADWLCIWFVIGIRAARDMANDLHGMERARAMNAVADALCVFAFLFGNDRVYRILRLGEMGW